MAPSRGFIDPETFKTMADTFDAAWTSVEGEFAGASKQEVETVRTALARTIIEVTNEGYDAALIKRAALGALGTFAKPSDTLLWSWH